MFDFLQLEFMQRAFIAGLALAPLLAVLGSFATLRKMSFFADGIAHASLLGVAIAIAVGATPFYGALVIGVLLGILIYALERHAKLASDSVIGIVFTTGIALGVIVISQEPGYQPDLLSFLFGNVLSVSWGDVWLIVGLSSAILALVAGLFRQITFVSFSPELAWVSGVQAQRIDLLFYIMLSVAIVLGVKLLGVILVSALLITPAVTAKLIANSFSSYVGWAIIFGTAAFVTGLTSSYHLDYPSGASIVVSSTLLFAFTFVLSTLRRTQ